MALFTVQTASEMGKRSAALRKQREEQRALILSQDPLPTKLETDQSQGKAERTRKQIELLDQMIEQSDDADILDALTRSKERLFRIWAHLAGLPGPGNLKPSSKAARPSWSPSVVSMPAPAPPAPLTPQQVVPGPDSSAAPPTEHKP